MCEIMFRGKRLDNGEWALGYLIQEPSGKTFIGTYAVTGSYWDWAEVDQTTVGQYSGLADKFYFKIFSGDVVRVSTKCFEGTFVARFEAGCFILVDESGFTITVQNYHRSELEVIGNIHDKPNLLKGVQNADTSD